MAENIYYSPMDISDVERTKLEEEEEIYRQIEELNVSERERKSPKCECCVCKGWYDRVATFLCFVCEIYVCVNCFPEHESHKGVKVWRKESNYKGEKRETGESERMNEQGLRERLHAKQLWDDVKNETEIERDEKFKSNKVSICHPVEVKDELDQKDCWITGLCGLENKKWVVCDYRNSCIKIFTLGSHMIQRYIRFVGSDSKPRDVTEIVKQNSTEPNLVSDSSSDFSATDWADMNEQCLIAVTLPGKRQIMFIDLSKKSAKVQKITKTETRCYSIQFYDNMIFTVCGEGSDSPFYVYIYSTDGDTLTMFDTGIHGYSGPRLAVVSGRVYLTDYRNNNVQCRNVEGQFFSETIKGSVPLGVSVDPDNNIYVCAYRHNKVYKLDADLTRYKSVLDQTTDYMERPDALCYYRDKLFISHGGSPSLENFITVVQLL